MPSTDLRFASRAEHRAWLEAQSRLPDGFRVGSARLAFTPVEVPKPARMALTLIALDRPTASFAARFTRNGFPGAPVLVGRARLAEPALGAIIVNNKVSNVCAPGGVEAAEAVCDAAARALGLRRTEVLPASTGVIGWRLPTDAMVAAMPEAAAALQGASVLPAAEGIMTTDLYPKIRRAELPGGASVVAIAKGAGMVEPDLATMLAFVLTDAELPREALREALDEAIDGSFHAVTVDSDTSTSDMVVALASGARGRVELEPFSAALRRVCRDLAEDLVRNGEGVHHVIRVAVTGARDRAVARGVGKSIVSSPLFQCAVSGNDPNVGRLLCAIGKYTGREGIPLDPARVRITLGGELILEDGAMRLDPGKEQRLVEHLRAAELYATAPAADGITFRPPIDYPPHERSVGADRTHEYITENADYRS
jgi:glutamate N-acetyltransferase/amino-acid N-acetyltransferase